MRNGECAHKKFPQKWAWPTSRDPTIFGILSNISSKLFRLVTLNLVSGFDCRVLHRVYYGAVRSAILATAWLLVDFLAVNTERPISSNRLGGGLDYLEATVMAR